MLEHIGRALGHQTTPGDDPDPVGQFVGLLQVLGGEEDGHRQFGIEPTDLRPHAVAAGRVQSRGGLVEEEDLGVVHQGGGQIEPALHPAGIGADAPVDGPTDVHQIQNVAESGPDLGRSQPVEPSLEGEQFPARLTVVQRGGLEGHPDTEPHLLGFLDDVVAGHRGVPGARAQQRAQHPQEGGLARSVRTQEPVDLSGGDVQVNPVHGHQ